MATAPPTALNAFIDFPVSVIVPNVYDIWLAGEIQSQGFASDAQVEYPFLGGVNLPIGQPIPTVHGGR